jgi:hypothetical protein
MKSLGANTGANKAVIFDASGNIVASSATSAELAYMSGVTSAIQTQLNSKWVYSAATIAGVKVNNSFAADAATKTTYVSCPDGPRDNSTTKPNSLPNTIRYDFMNGAVLGSTLGGSVGNYTGVMTYAPWDGTSLSTGDCSYQLAFASTVANGGIPRLAIRNGINTTWNTWYDVWHRGNMAMGTSAPASPATGMIWIDTN